MSDGERKASAAELLASVVEELRTGSAEAERVRELAQAAAKLLGGLPPPPELVEGLVRCGLTVKEITGVLGPLPEQATEAGAPADAASIKQLTYVPGLLGELIEWNVRTLWSSWIQYDSVKKAKEDSVRVYSPAFAIFGVTTAGDFYSALKIEDASNGFLNRFLILEETSRGEEKEPESWVGDVPFALMERLHKTAAKYQSAPGGGPVKPQSKLGWGPDAFKLYQQFHRSVRSESDDRVLELRIRAPEMAVRLATIRACGRSSKTVDVADIEWAIELARASADMLCAGVAEHVVPEGLDGLCEKIIEVLRRKNGVCSVRDTYRSVRRRIKRPNDLEAALGYLFKEERIKVENPGGKWGQVVRVRDD